MDEMTIRINLAAEGVEGELDDIIGSLQSFVKTVQGGNGAAADRTMAKMHI